MQLVFNPEGNVLQAFATPILRFALPNGRNINPGLLQAILKRRKEGDKVSRSNVKGWHSEDDFFKWPEPEVTDLADSIRSAVSHAIAFTSKRQTFQCKFDLVGWANVMQKGAYHSVHNHPFCHWSGVYYVQTGQTEDTSGQRDGNIEFYDPRGGVNMMPHPGSSGFGTSLVLGSMEACMLLFPSWLFHNVNTSEHIDQRVSIAFNARITHFAEKPETGQ